MLNKETNEYMSEPPKYPCIQSESKCIELFKIVEFVWLIFKIIKKKKDSKNNINEFISMNTNSSHGVVLGETEFRNFFRKF